MQKIKNPRNAGRKQKGLYKKSLNAPITTKAIPYEGIYSIYGLAASNEPEIIKYVGYTSMKMNVRYNNHTAQAKHDGTPKEKWIKSVLDEGHKIIMIILEDGILMRKDAFEKEKQYIKKIRNAEEDSTLTNLTEGGPGIPGMIHSEETRERQREANLGRQFRLGQPVTESTREKLRAAARNRKERALEVKQNNNK